MGSTFQLAYVAVAQLSKSLTSFFCTFCESQAFEPSNNAHCHSLWTAAFGPGRGTLTGSVWADSAHYTSIGS